MLKLTCLKTSCIANTFSWVEYKTFFTIMASVNASFFLIWLIVVFGSVELLSVLDTLSLTAESCTEPFKESTHLDGVPLDLDLNVRYNQESTCCWHDISNRLPVWWCVGEWNSLTSGTIGTYIASVNRNNYWQVYFHKYLIKPHQLKRNG